MALALPTRALADTTFSVQLRAPAGCPKREAFVADVERRSQLARPVARGEQPAITFVVQIDSRKGGFVGRILITEGRITRERRVEDKTCAEVSSALAFVAALAADPFAEKNPVAPLALPPDVSGPPKISSQPALQVGNLGAQFKPGMQPNGGSVVADPLPVLPEVRPDPLAPTPHLFWGGYASFDVSVGVFPWVGLGLSFGGEVFSTAAPEWSVRLTGAYQRSSQASPMFSGTSTFERWAGQLGVCVPKVRFGWVGFTPCGTLLVGALTGVALVGERELAATGPWRALRPTGRLELSPNERWGFGLETGPEFVLVSPVFVNDLGEELARSARATGALSLGFRAGF